MPPQSLVKTAFARRSTRLVISTLFAVAVSGCVKDDASNAITAPNHALTSSQLQTSGYRPEERLLADLAAAAPTSAGLLFKDGALIVRVRDSRDDGPALAATQDFVLRGRVRPGRPGTFPLRIERAEFTFAELNAWRNWAFDNVLPLDGVWSLDLDEAANRVTIGVDSSRVGELSARINALIRQASIDTAGFRVVAEAKHSLTSALATFFSPPDGSNIQGRVRPLLGGISMMDENNGGNGCTIGITAYRSGVPSFISASHCTYHQWGFDGDVIRQPYGSGDIGDRVGVESADPSGYTCGLGVCRESDAAAFSINSGVPWEKGLIARTTYSAGPCYSGPPCMSGSLTIDTSHPYFVISGSTSPVVGTFVHKVGMWTGWTYGSVVQTCNDFKSTSGPGLYDVTTCATDADYVNHEGDSGSPVFVWDGGDQAFLAGINFGQGGYAYFSPISRVVTNLGILDYTRGYNLATPNLSGYVDGGHPVLTFSSSPGATKYHIYRYWYDNVTGDGSGTVQYLGTAVASPWMDYDIGADLYTGETMPGPRSRGYIEYYIYAANETDISLQTSSVFFQLYVP